MLAYIIIYQGLNVIIHQKNQQIWIKINELKKTDKI